MGALVLREFHYGELDVRCVGSDRDLWFIAKDVCDALGIAWRGFETIANIPEDWKGVRKLRTPRRNPDGTLGFQLQEVIVIKEFAVYKLAFRSNKESAEAFTNWVAGEVIPAIRKTGEYRARTHRHYQVIGKTRDWIEERDEGIEQRKTFTGTLKAHEATNYAAHTNSIYRPVLGGSAAALKMALQIKPKGNLRDSLSTDDLARVKFAEMLAAEKIEADDLRGDKRCQAACSIAGHAVAAARQMVRNAVIDEREALSGLT